MKKKILLISAAVVAIALGVVGFGAFEAHIINVTAHIENALTVPLEADGLSFGTVFPEEVAYRTFDMRLSDSFMSEPRVDDVEYVLRQKPKCGVPISNNTNGNGTHLIEYSQFVQVTEDGEGNFICPEINTGTTEDPVIVQSVMLPLLCPYLSKTELDVSGATTTNAIPAFHGPLIGWDMEDTIATQLAGRLSKASNTTSTSWLLDLHAPCFKGQCAQDNVIPAEYQYDPAFEGQLFGCDLWIEVTNVSLSDGTPQLTLIKTVINDDGGTLLVSDFPLFINGIPAVSGTAYDQNANVQLTATETPQAGYTASVWGGDCAADGTITLLPSEHKTCTITNDDNELPAGTLTVIKVVVDEGDLDNKVAADFQMTIDDVNVTQGVANPVSVGDHKVSEVDQFGYIKTYSGDCDVDGDVTIANGDDKICTVTNTFPFFTVTVNKVVVNTPWNGNNLLSDFNLFVGPYAVTSGVSKKVAVGSYLISESGVGGYNAIFSGDCDSSTQMLTGANGENKTCTVTNTVIAPNITLVKVVDSGSALPTDFIMRIDGGAPVPTSSSKTVTANAAHTITEDAKAGYHFVSITGDIKCPATLGGSVTLDEGVAITCTIHNAQD